MKQWLTFLVMSTVIRFSLTYEGFSQFNPLEKVDFPFERKIWTYWNSYDGEVPLIVQACLSNMEIVAKKHNFTFVCLNEQNVRDYIENYDQEFLEVRKKSIQYGNTHGADLLRILVLEQHGGMWVDSTTIFINGLTELENIMSEKYRNLITNRFSHEPDMLLFHFSMGQNRIWSYIPDPSNSSSKILYNELPNLEVWAILSKKRSLIITQIKKTYVEFTCTPVPVLTQKMISQDIYFNKIDNWWSYLYIDMAVSYTLQKKQMQIDKRLGLVGTRKSAFEQYKLWSIHSELGPFQTLKEDEFSMDDLFLCSKEEAKALGMRFYFFVKYTGFIRNFTNQKFKLIKQAFPTLNQTFESFMKSGPSIEQCKNMIFPVQNSIMHNLLKQASLIQRYHIPIISKKQNQIYQQYCDKLLTMGSSSKWSDAEYQFKKLKKTFINTIALAMKFPGKIPLAKVNQIVAMNDGIQGVDEWINILWKDNKFLIIDFGLMLILSLMIFAIYGKTFEYFISRMLRAFNLEVGPIQINSQRKKLVRKVFFLVFSLNLMLYDSVDILCGRQQPWTIFFCILVTIVAQIWIQKEIQVLGQENPSYYSLKYEYDFLNCFVDYFIAYFGLVYVRRNRFMLNYYAFVMGLIGPCIHKLQKQLRKNQKQGEQAFSIWNPKKNIHRYLILITQLVTNIFPNLRYIAGPQGYYIKLMPFFVICYLFFRFLTVLSLALSKILFYETTRLLILFALSIILYHNISMAEDVIHEWNRMLYVGRVILFVAVIRLQMGTEIKLRAIKKVVDQKIMLMGFVGFVLYQLAFGKLWKLLYLNSDSWLSYSEHILLIAYGSFLNAFLSSVSLIQIQPQFIYLQHEQPTFQQTKLPH